MPSRRRDALPDLQSLLARQHSSFQRSVDPKTGLSLYGPWGTPDDPPLTQVRVGIIGTGETVTACQAWLQRCRQRVDASPEDDADPVLAPFFPGFEAKNGFNCRLEVPLIELFTPSELAKCVNAPGRDFAVEATTKVIATHLEALADRASPPAVVIVALPSEIRTVAGSGRRPSVKPSAPDSNQGAFSFMAQAAPPPKLLSRTLHRAMKAEGMRFDLPTQLAWPPAFAGGPTVQDDATRAWNFSTALYYKALGTPWRITGLARNTCYVGISFFRPIGQPGELQSSMAQAFSDKGDGMVLRGESFEWDTRTQGPPCLSRQQGCRLIESVLTQYKKHHPEGPGRVVVHKSSGFSADEMAGMSDALKEIPYRDFLHVTRSSVRLLRAGDEPVLRGTVVELATRKYLLFTRGYIPFLQRYPGLRVPVPLVIGHQSGTGAMSELLAETLALTKMDYNSASFARSRPITLNFAENVGLILSELPDDVEPPPYYRFYM